MDTEQAVCSTRASKTQITIAIVMLLLAIAVFVKAAFFRGDGFLYALGAILLINGVLRLRGKST